MKRYLFTLGRSWELASAEITQVLFQDSENPERSRRDKAVLINARSAHKAEEKPWALAHGSLSSEKMKILKATPDFLFLESQEALDADKLLSLLGGTIKIAQINADLPNYDLLEEEIVKQITLQNISKITFGISFFENSQKGKDLAKNIKKKLQGKKISARFILPKTGDTLNSVVIKKQHITEFQIFIMDKTFYLGKTIQVQNFEDWSKRDYQRPCINPKAGMLPPKVARMMINLAYPIYQRQISNGQRPILLDPFCGVGTIPQEAMMVGWDIIASDQSEDMIDKTRKNLTWLKTQYPIFSKDSYYILDATHISSQLSRDSIDAIVTEPYLGPNFNSIPSIGQIEKLIIGLEKLYLGSLKDLLKVLKPKGYVIFTVPSFNLGKIVISCKKTIDNCEKLGYTRVSGPFPYSRPQAIVARNIYILKKKKNFAFLP